MSKDGNCLRSTNMAIEGTMHQEIAVKLVFFLAAYQVACSYESFLVEAPSSGCRNMVQLVPAME